MAKDLEQTEPAPAAAPASTAEQAARQQLVVDSSKAHAAYANFCRVTGTPEELIIDFGLNTQPMGVPNEYVVEFFAPTLDAYEVFHNVAIDENGQAETAVAE